MWVIVCWRIMFVVRCEYIVWYRLCWFVEHSYMLCCSRFAYTHYFSICIFVYVWRFSLVIYAFDKRITHTHTPWTFSNMLGIDEKATLQQIIELIWKRRKLRHSHKLWKNHNSQKPRCLWSNRSYTKEFLWLWIETVFALLVFIWSTKICWSLDQPVLYSPNSMLHAVQCIQIENEKKQTFPIYARCFKNNDANKCLINFLLKVHT